MYACMETSGVADKVGRENIFREEKVRLTSTLLAIRHAAALMGDRCPRCHGTGGGSPKGGLYYAI
jgi:hypothetical protein